MQAVSCFPPGACTKLTGRHDLLDGWMVKWCSNGRWPKAKAWAILFFQRSVMLP